MVNSSSSKASPQDPEQQRQLLLSLLRLEPRGAASREAAQVRELIVGLEQAMPADLTAPDSLKRLEGVWELRWSSSSQPYLAVAPWLENLQLLSPTDGRGMNLLRLTGPFASLASIALEAEIKVESAKSPSENNASRQRVQVRFQRGGWLGPRLGTERLRLFRRVKQSFPAWLDITVLDDELRVCRGNAGTLFALLRRYDLNLQELMLPKAQARARH